jgi:alpha-1,2-mannosyltransferase
MAILWRLLADRSDGAPMLLALTAVLLTPVVEVAISAGNNTPLLVLLAALPLTRASSRRWDPAVGVLVGVATVLKAFPGALIAVALHWRRLRLAAWALGTLAVLIALTLVVAPASIFADFVHSSQSWAAELTNVSANASITSYLTSLAPGLGGLITWGVRFGAVAMGVFLYRRLGEDLLWPCTLPVMLIVWPQVWVAYFLFTVVAVAFIVARSGKLWLLPVAAATTLPGAWAQHSYLNEPIVYVASLAAGWVVLLLALPPRPPAAADERRVEMSGVRASR